MKYGLSIRAALITAILVPEIVFTHIAGDEDIARQASMLQAAGQALMMLITFALCLGATDPASPASNKLTLPKFDGWLRILLGSFVCIIIAATVVGIARGFDSGYVVGDAYKFLAFPMLFYALYAGFGSSHILGKSIKYVFNIVLLAQIGCVGYYVILRQIHIRPLIIYMGPWLPSLLYCQYRSGMVSKSTALAFAPVVFFTFVAVSWGSQSLTYVALTMLIFAGTFYFHNRKRYGRLAIFVVLVTTIFACMLMLVDSDTDALQQVTNAVADPNFYMTRKFYFLFNNGFSLQTIELMGGDRLAQLLAVVRYWTENPLEAVFGQGMGGSIVVGSSVSGLQDRTWKELNHYIEGGYPQVMLRTGLVGIMVYVGIIVRFVRLAIADADKNAFSAMAATYLLYLSIFSIFNESLIGAGMESLFLVCFACAIVAWSSRQNRQLKQCLVP